MNILIIGIILSAILFFLIRNEINLAQEKRKFKEKGFIYIGNAFHHQVYLHESTGEIIIPD